LSPQKPLRVLITAPKYIIGGQNRQAADLIEYLRDNHGVDARLQPIDPRLPGPFQFLLEIRYLRSIVKLLLYTLQLMIRVPRFQIVHAYSAGLMSYTLSTLPALLVAKLYRRKFILFYVDGRLGEHLETYRTAVPTMRLADVIVGANQHIQDVMAKYGLNARVIHNAVRFGTIHYRKRRELKPRLMTNRLLEPLYNHPCIFRAFARVLDRYPSADLIVGNEGFLRPQLEQLAKDMGLRNYKFIGVRPYEEVPAIYDAAEIYLTSPNVDCMPASILECFEAGLPVVATRAGGIAYMIRQGETGFLVDIDDDEAMAECVFRLLEDPDLVERITAAAKKEVAPYSWESVAARWNSLYLELVGD
jgi:glycosyltransferase involved in cell wall biosynthesis